METRSRDIFHIFLKDLRRMWVPLAALAALLISADVLEVRRHFHDEFRAAEATSFLGALVVPLGWIVVIAGVVLQDRLQGNSQYWLTRPVSRWRLLGAKLLFVAVFVNLLWFVSDCVILHALGLPIPPLVLLARQIPMTVVLFGPVVGLATMVRNAGQFALGLLLSLLAVVLELIAPHWFGRMPATFFSDGIPRSVEVALWVGIVALTFFATLWQFMRNSTVVARTALAFAILLIPIATLGHADSPLFGIGARTRTSNVPGAFGDLQVSFDFSDGRRTRRSELGFEVPVRVAGTPYGVLVSASGNSQVLGEHTKRGATLHSGPDGYWLDIGGTDLKGVGPVAAYLQLEVWQIAGTEIVEQKRRGALWHAAGFVCRDKYGEFHCWHAPDFEYAELLDARSFGNDRSIHLGSFPGLDANFPLTFSPVVEIQLSVRDDFGIEQTRFLTLKPLGTLTRTIKADAVDFSQ